MGWVPVVCTKVAGLFHVFVELKLVRFECIKYLLLLCSGNVSKWIGVQVVCPVKLNLVVNDKRNCSVEGWGVFLELCGVESN